ncbi:MAG: PHP domain-containing protein [Acidobacteriota bacterium]
MKKVSVFFLSFLFLLIFLSSAQEYKWYKGNTHCHTLNSDGDSYPRQVIRWYRDHEYNFLVISDHNFITENKYHVEVNPYKDAAYTITFIGKNGQSLQESYGTTAEYIFKRDELYVRARIYESSGRIACTQPVFMKKN